MTLVQQDAESKNAEDAAVDQDKRRATTWLGGKSKVPTKFVRNTFLAYFLVKITNLAEKSRLTKVVQNKRNIFKSQTVSYPLDFSGIENSIELHR